MKSLFKNNSTDFDFFFIQMMIKEEFETLRLLLKSLRDWEDSSLGASSDEDIDKKLLISWTARRVYGSLAVIIVCVFEDIIFKLANDENELYLPKKEEKCENRINYNLLNKNFGYNESTTGYVNFSEIKKLNNSFKHNSGKKDCGEEIKFDEIEWDKELEIIENFLILLAERIFFHKK